VLASIERYREQHGEYPEALADLSPGFIDTIPDPGNEAGPTFAEYRRVGDDFEFTFSYFGPGINWCVYSVENEWRCDGHF